MSKLEEFAAQLRQLAEKIRRSGNPAEATAEGFELLASAMEPCYDCGHQDDDVIGMADTRVPTDAEAEAMAQAALDELAAAERTRQAKADNLDGRAL